METQAAMKSCFGPIEVLSLDLKVAPRPSSKMPILVCRGSFLSPADDCLLDVVSNQADSSHASTVFPCCTLPLKLPHPDGHCTLWSAQLCVGAVYIVCIYKYAKPLECLDAAKTSLLSGLLFLREYGSCSTKTLQPRARNRLPVMLQSVGAYRY